MSRDLVTAADSGAVFETRCKRPRRDGVLDLHRPKAARAIRACPDLNDMRQAKTSRQRRPGWNHEVSVPSHPDGIRSCNTLPPLRLDHGALPDSYTSFDATALHVTHLEQTPFLSSVRPRALRPMCTDSLYDTGAFEMRVPVRDKSSISPFLVSTKLMMACRPILVSSFPLAPYLRACL